MQSKTFKDRELVNISDGCEDDLSDLERDDRRIRVFYQPNRGVSIARNVGIARSAASLMARLDDDLTLPGRLLAQFGAVREADVGLCHSQYSFIDENGAYLAAGTANDSQYRDASVGYLSLPTC